jgi:hypothetical protein
MSEVEYDGDALNSFIAKIEKRLKDVGNNDNKFVALLSAIVFKDVNDHFKQQQGEQGKWLHWSFWYTLHMERIGKGGNKILQFNGRLRNSFKQTNVKKQDGILTWYNDAKTAKGFPYAYAHNEGGKKLPKRDFMWLSEGAVEKMAAQTLDYVLDERR